MRFGTSKIFFIILSMCIFMSTLCFSTSVFADSAGYTYRVIVTNIYHNTTWVYCSSYASGKGQTANGDIINAIKVVNNNEGKSGNWGMDWLTNEKIYWDITFEQPVKNIEILWSGWGYNWATKVKVVAAGQQTQTNINQAGWCATPNVYNTIAPTNLTAVLDNDKVKLSWDEVANATTYKIKRSVIAGGPYDTVANSAYTNFIDDKVTSNTTYYYVVSAINANGESSNSNEVSITPKAPSVSLSVDTVDKAKVGDEITADIVIHNANTICAEDIKITYDTNLLEYVSSVNADGMKIFKENDLTNGTRRYITASLGKSNAANGDKILLKLKFKAKAVGQAKIDIVKGRIADNSTLEVDVLQENCGEKIVTIEAFKDINRSGEFTLLDLGIDAYYYGDPASTTDTTKYDADIVANGQIDDGDLQAIVEQMLSNTNYPANQ